MYTHECTCTCGAAFSVLFPSAAPPTGSASFAAFASPAAWRPSAQPCWRCSRRSTRSSRSMSRSLRPAAAAHTHTCYASYTHVCMYIYMCVHDVHDRAAFSVLLPSAAPPTGSAAAAAAAAVISSVFLPLSRSFRLKGGYTHTHTHTHTHSHTALCVCAHDRAAFAGGAVFGSR